MTCGENIHLTPEKTSVILSGRIAPQDFCEFYFYGKKGHVLQVSFGERDHTRAFLYLPIEKNLTGNEPYVLPKNGRYTLRVVLNSQTQQHFVTPQHFTLHFSLHKREKNTDSVIGRFGAIIPCEYCTGIETWLTISENGTYFLKEKYLGVGANSSFYQNGNWFLRGQAIVLHPDDPSQDERFLLYQNGAMYWIAAIDVNNANPTVRRDYRLSRQ